MPDPTLQREIDELHNEAGGGGQSSGGARNESAAGDGEKGPDYDGGQLAGGYHVIHQIADQADVLGEPWALKPEEKHALSRDIGKIADRHLPEDSADMPPWADYVFAAFTVIAIAAPRYAIYQQAQQEAAEREEAEARARRQPEKHQEQKQTEGESDGAET